LKNITEINQEENVIRGIRIGSQLSQEFTDNDQRMQSAEESNDD